MTYPSIPTGEIRDSRPWPGDVFNPYKFRVYLGSAQNITSQGTPQTVVNVAMDATTQTFDTSMGWDSTNHRYVVPVTGYWFIAGNVSYAPAGAMTWFVGNGELLVNGVTHAADNVVNGNVTAVLLGTSYNALAYDTMYLAKGDLLTLTTTQQNSAALAQPLNANSKSTYLSGHLISR
jgi:hypothetical protein